MPSPAYNQVTVAQFIAEVQNLMDDTAGVYWTAQEIQFWLNEALYYWGATTSYWRTRGTFPITPVSQPYSPLPDFGGYYDLSVQLPALRPRTYTIDQLVREIQYMLLEAPNGLSGAGMSQQISVTSIIESVVDASNRFIMDVHFPIVQGQAVPTPPIQGMCAEDLQAIFVHRAVWRDVGGQYFPLWRQDTWASDKGMLGWPTTPGMPIAYSEAENAPILLQLIPPPLAPGSLATLEVQSYANPSPSSRDTLPIPNEWCHAVKYAALSRLFTSLSQIEDPTRAKYCEERYQQSINLAKGATSIIRALVNNVPLPIVPITDLDLGYIGWMNQTGAPFAGAVLYDILAVSPGQPDNTYGAAIDVVQAAPIPTLSGYLPVGQEEVNNLQKYVCHLLSFKCGGKDFTSTMGEYDAFMGGVESRVGVNKAKIQYLQPLFNQPQKEWGIRPDRVMQNA